MRDPRVLAALRSVPRRGFVPPGREHEAEIDAPIPIDDGQVTTQPSLVAAMVEALGLEGDERVLEVGTGLGYQAAILAHLAAEVYTVERFPSLAAAAERNLAAAGLGRVTVVVADGSCGLPDYAPYAAIIVAAAFPTVPAPLVEQLDAGGRLVQPIGPGGRETVTLFERTGDGLRRVRTVTGARFVRFVGAHAYDRP